MHTTTTRAARPRSLVTHIIHLTGANPVDARLFANSSGRAAIKRLKIKPVIKARTRTTVTGRHLIVATGMGTKKNVRRRKGVPVHRWTLGQAIEIINEMKPRKTEYKEIQQAAILAGLDATSPLPTLRRLPRHRRWSKRR